MADEDEIKAKRLFPALTVPSELELARKVIDADEEIFLLYTLYAPEKDRQGLGQVDSKKDVLALTLDLADCSKEFEVSSLNYDRAEAGIKNSAKGKGTAVSQRKGKLDLGTSTTLQVQIRQSSASLRTDAGDTGSIIWRSSLSLAEKLVRDLERTKERKRLAELPFSLMDIDELLKCKVLELGSGTGVLPRILCDYLEAKIPSHELVWIATDQKDILPLLRKNVSKSKVFVEELDWVEASRVYRSHSSSMLLHSFLKDLFRHFSQSEDTEWTYPDLVIATDCIFNPSLAQPFIDTLNLCSGPYKTVAMVVCELRESEMMMEFLSTWLKRGSNGEQWNVNALSGADIVGRLACGSIVWVAWRSS